MKLEDHLAEIRANLDDPAPYLVFADWLQEQGNPWGRLIMLQHALEQRPGDGAVAAAAEQLASKHGWAPKTKPKLLRLDWRWGFIRAIRVYDEYAHEDVAAILQPIFELPMAAHVQSCLVFRDPRYDHGERPLSAVQRPPHAAEIEVVGPANVQGKEAEAPPTDARWLSAGGRVPATVSRFTQVAWLCCSGIGSLPEAVGKLPLERLDIDWCQALPKIPDSVWGIESLGYISMYDAAGLGLNMAQVNNLLFGFVRARTPRAQRIVEAALFRGETPQTVTREQLLLALDSNVKAVRTRALAVLESELENPLPQSPLGESSVVAVLGAINIDKKALKARLEAIGARLATTINAKTTHALLGERPGGKQHELGTLPVLLEAHLTAAGADALPTAEASTPSGAGPNLTQLAQDLRSKQDAKIVAAVAALQTLGTIPRELLPELLLVLQNTELEKLGKGRRQAKKLFAAYAPPALQAAVAKHMKTSVLLAGETKRATRLQAVEQAAGHELEMAQLARLLVEDHDCGLKWILARKDPVELCWALAQRITNKRIDLARLELPSLPELSAFSELEEVDASGNHLGAFPVALATELPKLRRLDLSGNYLRTLPANLSAFCALHSLDLGHNRFETFPRGVTTIAGLRELDLSSDTWGETRITMLPKELLALKQLESLEIENGRQAVELAPELAAMTWLKRLKTTWRGESSEPPAELTTLLPGCEIS